MDNDIIRMFAEMFEDRIAFEKKIKMMAWSLPENIKNRASYPGYKYSKETIDRSYKNYRADEYERYKPLFRAWDESASGMAKFIKKESLFIKIKRFFAR